MKKTISLVEKFLFQWKLFSHPARAGTGPVLEAGRGTDDGPESGGGWERGDGHGLGDSHPIVEEFSLPVFHGGGQLAIIQNLSLINDIVQSVLLNLCGGGVWADHCLRVVLEVVDDDPKNRQYMCSNSKGNECQPVCDISLPPPAPHTARDGGELDPAELERGEGGGGGGGRHKELSFISIPEYSVFPFWSDW